LLPACRSPDGHRGRRLSQSWLATKDTLACTMCL